MCWIVAQALVRFWQVEYNSGFFFKQGFMCERLIPCGGCASGYPLPVYASHDSGIFRARCLIHWICIEHDFGLAEGCTMQHPCHVGSRGEIDEAKAAWLAKQVSDPDVCLFKDNATLCNERAPCRLHVAGTGLGCRVPHSRLLLAGFSCKSRSSLNKSASKNVGCVQRGEELTGESWTTVFNHAPRLGSDRLFRSHVAVCACLVSLPDFEVRTSKCARCLACQTAWQVCISAAKVCAHHPDGLVLENLTSLKADVPDSDVSDAEYIARSRVPALFARWLVAATEITV